MHYRLSSLCVLLACLWLPGYVAADSDWKQGGALNKAIIFAGTSIRTNGQEWAYLLWQPGDDSLLEGRTLAIYRKSGTAASAAPYALESVLTFTWDARTAAAVLKRSENVGQDLSALDSALQANFRDVLPPPMQASRRRPCIASNRHCRSLTCSGRSPCSRASTQASRC